MYGSQQRAYKLRITGIKDEIEAHQQGVEEYLSI